MTRAERRAQGNAIRDLVRTLPDQLALVPVEEWLPRWPFEPDRAPIECWRSRWFTVQVYAVPTDGAVRLSVQRTDRQDGISWDELQGVKAQIGRGDCWAVELFPPDERVVNVANMRHLWLLSAAPSFGWKRGAT